MTSGVQSSKNNKGFLKKESYLVIIDKQITPFFRKPFIFYLLF